MRQQAHFFVRVDVLYCTGEWPLLFTDTGPVAKVSVAKEAGERKRLQAGFSEFFRTVHAHECIRSMPFHRLQIP